MNTLATSYMIDVTLEKWLQYAFSCIPDFILTSSVIIVVSVVLYVGVAHLWGKCWNKDWSIMRSFFLISFLALVSAACVAAGDCLCNGDFKFFSEGSSKIAPAFNGDSLNKVDSPEAYVVAASLVKKLQLRPADSDDEAGESAENEYTVSETCGRSYAATLNLLRWVPVSFLLLILLLVPWLSYVNIREIHPLSIDNK